LCSVKKAQGKLIFILCYTSWESTERTQRKVFWSWLH